MYQPRTATLTLLVDTQTGRVLDAPPNVNVSERWVNSHPFVNYAGHYLYAGPDAYDRVGGDYVTYRVEGRAFGTIDLIREA